MKSGHRQGGAGLLEVLVALFVFGVGMLGATALSVQAYRLENRAQIRARVGMLAADLIDRIRCNAAGLAAYGGDAAEHGCSSGLSPARICTPEELAADDLAFFNHALRALAPTATVDLLLDPSTSPPTGRLSVAWRDGAAVQEYGTGFAL